MFLLNICLLKVPDQIAPTFTEQTRPNSKLPQYVFLIIMIIIIIIQGLNTNYLNVTSKGLIWNSDYRSMVQGHKERNNWLNIKAKQQTIQLIRRMH